MADDKLKEALEMARQMDEQVYEEQDVQSKEKLERFLDIISQIESSGGKNFAHRPITEGIHAGTSAAGTYGLMPNTMREISSRSLQEEMPLSEEALNVSELPAQRMKQEIERQPGLEKEFAERLADRVLTRYPTEEEAAYSWMYGHNISPQEMQERPYEESDYVKKYKRFKSKLFGEDNE